MTVWFGDYPEDWTTVSVYFTTHATTGAPIAPLSAFETADFVIFKDGSATQKATTNGLTIASPFDAIVGLHRLLIDTSIDTGDVGFWTSGSVYTVVLKPDETVDGVSVLSVVGAFGIGMANSQIDPASLTEIADGVLDRTDGIETGVTLRQALRGMAAALMGKLSGGGTTTITIRDINDAKARITATVDGNKNRTAITKDLT